MTLGVLRPCLDCGTPSEGSRCDEHAAAQAAATRPRSYEAERGYDRAWRALSARARRMSPMCEVCFTAEDLTADHTPEAWRRKAAGLPVRLRDIRILCRRHNASAGPARGADARR
jgi:5-methylcytosine-specific restriction enzyme A